VVPIDEMIELALEALLSGSEEIRRGVVRRMCERWPDAPALSLVFALTNAAAMIEDNIAGKDADRAIGPLAFRMAAILSADIYAVESLGLRPATAHDLLHFWRRVDPPYLSL
jgi:hypothetical protein